jgi:hypothetical protein
MSEPSRQSEYPIHDSFAKSDDDVGLQARDARAARPKTQPRATTKQSSSARAFPSSRQDPGTLTTASPLVGNLLSI